MKNTVPLLSRIKKQKKKKPTRQPLGNKEHMTGNQRSCFESQSCYFLNKIISLEINKIMWVLL